MKKTEIRELADEFVGLAEYLEALNFEVESRRALLVFALEKGLRGTGSFEEYEREYKEFFIKYEQAKREFSQRAIPELLEENGPKVSWELDFGSKRLRLSWEACHETS